MPTASTEPNTHGEGIPTSVPAGAALDDREFHRLEALARYAILDTLPETAFDRLTRLAATHFGTPIALISLVDDSRQWFKACYGLDLRQTSRSLSFCAHALGGTEVLVVPDARQDVRFHDNVLVTGAPFIRFYAGAPLLTPDGHALGTLCVISPEPRDDFNEAERATLQDLAALVMDELELRLVATRLTQEVSEKQRALTQLHEALRFNGALLGVQALMELQLDPISTARQALPLLADAANLDGAQLLMIRDDHLSTALAYQRPGLDWRAWNQVPDGLPRSAGPLWRAHDADQPVFVEDYPATPGAHPLLIELGLHAGAWLPLGHYDGVTYLMGALCLARKSWRSDERALLQTGARTLRAALEAREQERQRERELHTDALTGLANRRALEGVLDTQHPLLIAAVDLNGLKAVNDQQGHEQGDALLRLFATSLAVALPEGTRAFRQGGDEFVLLRWGEGTDPLAADDLLCALDMAVAALRAANYQTVGAAVGLAHFPREAATAREALRLADARMYADKRDHYARTAGASARSTSSDRLSAAER